MLQTSQTNKVVLLLFNSSLAEAASNNTCFRTAATCNALHSIWGQGTAAACAAGCKTYSDPTACWLCNHIILLGPQLPPLPTCISPYSSSQCTPAAVLIVSHGGHTVAYEQLSCTPKVGRLTDSKVRMVNGTQAPYSVCSVIAPQSEAGSCMSCNKMWPVLAVVFVLLLKTHVLRAH